MMRIGIDIDGVILDYEKQMRFYAEYYDVINGYSGKINNDFNYLKNYTWNTNKKNIFKEEYLIKGTHECALVPGSKLVIDLMHDKKLEIIIITARGSINKKTKDEVLKVLNKFNIYYDSIYFEVTDKVKVCKKLKIDLMIDDNPQTCCDLKKNRIKTIYFKDNDKKIRGSKYLITLNNWGEVLRYLYDNKIIDK